MAVRRTEADVCRVWAAGALTWIEAVEVLRRRHLADLYACSYRCGILPTRRLSEEAGLPTVLLVPWRWRRYPEWHHHWKARLREGGWGEDEIERTARDLAAGIDIARRPFAHDDMWRRMQEQGRAFSASIAARRDELDLLLAEAGDRDRAMRLLYRLGDAT